MTGAIRISLNDELWADIYLAGTYDRIEWSEKYPSEELGERYYILSYKETADKVAGIIISRGLDERFVLRLKETKRYVVRILSKNNKVVQSPFLPHFQNEGKFLKCDRDRDSVVFQFINYLGRSRMHFPEYGFELLFEVVPDKMDYEEDYIRLTEEIAEKCTGLLLDYSGSTSNTYRPLKDDPSTLLEQFIFLRQFCYGQNLLALFEAIKRNPDRLLAREEILKPFGTGKPSERFYRNPFQYAKRWNRIKGENDDPDICIPQMIAISRKYDSMDTPANRFIKFALHRFDSVCTGLIEALGKENNKMEVMCLDEARAIHGIIEDIFADAFFDDVGDLDMIPQNNQVLQKREGYSQIFAAYSMIDLALQLDWKGKDDIYEGESRNVALLYEYWLFFELYGILCSIEGCNRVNTEKNPFLSMDNKIVISLHEEKESAQYFADSQNGVKINLYYNRTFSNNDFASTKYEGSYSRPFRPDYSIAVFPDSFTGNNNGEDEAIFSGAVSYIHFDAKYRVTNLTALFSKPDDNDKTAIEEEINEEKRDSVNNTYKRGDLLKMHTYNDAIRRTVGSYILYPGSDSSCQNTFSLYDEILPGVGAFAIKPSTKGDSEEEIKNFIVQVIESVNERASRFNRMNYYSEMILSEPSRKKSQEYEAKKETLKEGDMYVLGFIRSDFFRSRKLSDVGTEFYYFFYAIEGEYVYPHHKDLFKIPFYRFYKNNPSINRRYILEPMLCKIISSELVSRKTLTELLEKDGYKTDENAHRADYYYIIRVKVIDSDFGSEELSLEEVNRYNGNNASTPISPKIMTY